MSRSGELERIAKLRATEVRQGLGLAAHEPIDIFKVLRENVDISFVLRPFSSAISGMFLRMSAAEVIVINTAKSLGHQRFTAAHEYYHLRFDKGMSTKICATGKFDYSSPSEIEADYFAANYLMPAEAVTNRLTRQLHGKLSIELDDVIDLEQHFGVSHAAMLLRLKQLQHISKTKYEQLRKVPVILAARTLGYEISLYRATNENRLISSYAAKAKNALDRGYITFGKYEQLLLEAGLADLLYDKETMEVSYEDF